MGVLKTLRSKKAHQGTSNKSGNRRTVPQVRQLETISKCTSVGIQHPLISKVFSTALIKLHGGLD